MTVWTYWSETPASASNLRLLVPGRGWVSYADKLDAESKVAERGSQEQIDSALINVLSASNFLALTLAPGYPSRRGIRTVNRKLLL